MASELPLYARPLVGWMQWQMARGHTPDVVLEMAHAHPDYHGWQEWVYTAAMRKAQRNIRLGDIAQADFRACFPHCALDNIRPEREQFGRGTSKTLGECQGECGDGQ